MVKRHVDGSDAVWQDPECIGDNTDSPRSKSKVMPLSMTSARREVVRMAASSLQGGSSYSRLWRCCSFHTLLWLMIWLTCGFLGHCLMRQSDHIRFLEKRLMAEEERLLQHRFGDHDSGLGPGRAYQALSEECFNDTAWKLISFRKKTLLQCRQECDKDRRCKGFSFKSIPTIPSTCVTRTRACENIVPGPCDWSQHWCAYTAMDGFQSRLCPDDMPSSDPWWSQYASPGKRHKHCLTREKPKECPDVPITNRERIMVLRQLLNATHRLMTALDIEYAVLAGTTIGYYRCKDVLPWDGDNDIVVQRQGIPKLVRLFREPNSDKVWRNASLVGRCGVDFNDYMLTEVEGCIGWRIVHLPTGLYTDFFVSDIVKSANFDPEHRNYSRYLYFYGNKACRAKDFRDSFFDKNGACDWKKCSENPAEWFWPARPCKIGGVDVMCPRQAEEYVKQTYKGVDSPDVPLRGLI